MTPTNPAPQDPQEQTSARFGWQLLAVLTILAAVLAGFHDRIGPDLWPLDRSPIGPNLLADAITFAAGFLLGAREIARQLHHHHTAMHARHDAHNDRLDRIEARLERVTS